MGEGEFCLRQVLSPFDTDSKQKAAYPLGEVIK